MFQKITYMLFVFTFSTDYSLGTNTEVGFYQLSNNFVYNKKLFPKESVSFDCSVNCHNCSKKTFKWYHDGRFLEPDDNFTFDESSITIREYLPAKHSGRYFCSLSSTYLNVRSPSIVLETLDFPSFLIENERSYLNGLVVFTCYNVTSVDSYLFDVRWFKDGNKLESDDNRLEIWNEILLIKKIRSSDIGLYQCEITKRGTIFSRKSSQKTLAIQEVRNMSQSEPSIAYQTKDKQVLYNRTTYIFCATKGLANAVVRLYRKSEVYETMLKKSFHYLVYEETPLQNTVYICQAETRTKRTTREIKIIVYGSPRIEKDSLLMHQYLGKPISFDCSHDSYPVAKATWFHNGVPVTDGVLNNKALLTKTRLEKKDGGFYQCIVENSVGASMKYTYLSLQMSDLTPRNFTATIVSPGVLVANWEKPPALDDSKFDSYRLYYIDPEGRRWHKNTTKENILVRNLFGGWKYLLDLCLITLDGRSECVYDSIHIPVPVVLERLVMNEPITIEDQVFMLSWRVIPEGLALGVIRKYKVYYEILDGEYKGILNSTLLLEPKNTTYRLQLENKANYKIWLTAFTNDDKEGVKSNSLILQSFESNVGKSNLQVQWRYEWPGTASLKWLPTTNAIEYQLYYVPIPYNNYWKEVRSVKLPATTNLYTLNRMNMNRTYRFTIIPINKRKEKNNFGLKRSRMLDKSEFKRKLGYSSSAYLPKSSEFSQSFPTQNPDVVTAPSHMKCHDIKEDNEILVSWRYINNEKVTRYIVRYFSELDNKELTVTTNQTYILLKNVSRGFWYAVQVQGFGDSPNTAYLPTAYKSCRIRERVPSIVRDVKYRFVYDHSKEYVTLHIKWRPPEYLGASMFSYELIRFAESRQRKNGHVTFPFFPFEYSDFILGQQNFTDEIIMSLWTENAETQTLRQWIHIVAVNDAGIGKIYRNYTYYISHPTTPPSTSVTYQIPIPSNIRTGIIVGVSISVFFLLILIIVCAVKEPCKKSVRGFLDENYMSDDYLYEQRLKEVQNVSLDSSQNSSKVNVKKKSKEWKYLQVFRSCHKNYEPPNSSDMSSNTCVLYSTSSSGSSSGSRGHPCNRSRCDSDLVGSSSGLHSASEGHVTLLNDTTSTVY